MVPCLLLAHLFNPTCAHGGRWDFEVSERTKHELISTFWLGCEGTLLPEGRGEGPSDGDREAGGEGFNEGAHDDPMRFNSVAEHSWWRQGVGVNYLGHSFTVDA